MPSRIATAVATCALSLGVLASGAGTAIAASSPAAGPAAGATSPRPAIDARAAAVDGCSYQVVRTDDSRYVHSVSGVFAGGVRELPVQKEDFVRFSDGWRVVTQVDACAGGRTQAPTALRVTGRLDNPDGYDSSVPRTIRSGDAKPAASSVIPKAPAVTSVDRLDAGTVRVNWKPAQGSPDLVALMETKPFYSSEVGIWHPYTFQRDVPGGATSADRKLERHPDIPASARAHSYWMRVVKGGFVSDLRTEKPVTIEP
ncbi:hypothetical protein [Streptomyces albireticuli]|uniref:Fibronectin type-III domain-containing protein n=1 Tax=Streptomyces albireticuli TaxID=1940 RepID=A0A2A2D3L5_9ACTN|nr:hypothetical protein [Streptomyces albireticuli]MCD9195105.1 hypothetical protein [Streptomyces albireticuli]PAU47078.1 hypothetical protein CK936_20990 [Streptomyces albireticuli]